MRMKFSREGFTVSYWMRCFVNHESRGWRDHLGDVLRAIAQKLDGRYSLAVEITTLPPLSTQSRIECLAAGVQAIRRHVDDETKAAAIESLLALKRPELYKDIQNS